MEPTLIALVSVAVKLLVDIVKRFWADARATVTNVVAAGLGYGATFLAEVGTFADWKVRGLVATIIAGLSSVVAEATKTLRAIAASKAVPSEELR